MNPQNASSHDDRSLDHLLLPDPEDYIESIITEDHAQLLVPYDPLKKPITYRYKLTVMWPRPEVAL